MLQVRSKSLPDAQADLCFPFAHFLSLLLNVRIIRVQPKRCVSTIYLVGVVKPQCVYIADVTVLIGANPFAAG